MTDAVLDASVALALLSGEPVDGETLRIVDTGDIAISAVNLSEVAAKLLEKGADAETLAQQLDDLRLDVVAFDQVRALAAAQLHVATRQAGLSLGDRSCLALAKELGVPAFTTDRAWQQLDLGVNVHFSRPPASQSTT